MSKLVYCEGFFFFFLRGKGDGSRLGHGTEDHVRFPKLIEVFSGKKIVDVAVGSLHCLAVTEEGEVYSWGRNEQGQLGDTSNIARTVPTIINALDGKEITGVACGPAQVGTANKLCISVIFVGNCHDVCNDFWSKVHKVQRFLL